MKKEQFKADCRAYLMTVSVANLYAYGRHLNLTAPTKLKKAALIDRIIAVLCGEKIEIRNKRGAPIKNSNIDGKIPQEIENIRVRIFGEGEIEEKSKGEMARELTTEQQKEKTSVPFQLTIVLDKITAEQKKILRQFLNTL